MVTTHPGRGIYPLLAFLLMGSGADCGAEHTIPIESFTDQYEQAACALLTHSHLVSDQSYCVALFEAAYRTQVGFNSLEANIIAAQAGKAVFDGARASECIATLKGLSSDDKSGRTVTSACAGLFIGNLSEGESCIADGECRPGMGCQSSGECTGACAPLASGCGSGPQCPEGQVCDHQITCVKPKPPGAKGEACGTNQSCQVGLACSSSGSCGTGPTEGQPCDGLTCAQGLICAVENSFTWQGICSKALERGQSCQVPGQCGGQFFSELTCDPSQQICVDAYLGGPCVPPIAGFSFESFLGMSGEMIQWGVGCDTLTSYCDESNAVCTSYLTSGAACDPYSSHCGLSAYCKPDDAQGTTGTCVLRPNCSP
jgi:hypothetical protein